MFQLRVFFFRACGERCGEGSPEPITLPICEKNRQTHRPTGLSVSSDPKDQASSPREYSWYLISQVELRLCIFKRNKTTPHTYFYSVKLSISSLYMHFATVKNIPGLHLVFIHLIDFKRKSVNCDIFISIFSRVYVQ